MPLSGLSATSVMIEVRETTTAGLRIRRSGCGQPLLMLHGWAMSSAVFSELLIAPPAGLELICVDLPGHGGSPALRENSLDDWALSVEALAGALGLQSCSLLGWSLGGMLAQHLVLRGRLDVRHLVLIATSPRFTAAEDWPNGLQSLQLRAMQRDLKRDFRRTLEGFFGLMFADGELDRNRYRQIARFATGPALLPEGQSAADGLRILQQTDLRAQVGSILQPSLVLHGTCDDVIPLTAGEWLGLNLPAGRIEPFVGCGHAPFLSHPERCLDLIGDFCA